MRVSQCSRGAAALLSTVAIAALLAIAPSRTVGAQVVGSRPEQSPYRDLPTTQQLTLSVGWLSAANDAANVGPNAAPLFSLRHDLHVGGPAWLTTRYGMMRSERRVIDGALPAAEREQGMLPVTHHLADIGLTIALTGRKSWHNTVPTLGGGVGLTSDFGQSDVGGYRFGTKFAFTFGPGLRVLLPRGYSMRLDVTNNVYQFQYPGAYFVQATDSTRVLTNPDQRSGWLSNWSFNAGFSVPIFR